MTAVRINVGCGPYRLEGFINIDLYRDERRSPDVLARGLSLPFRDGAADEVYAGHVIEHLTYQEAARFFRECLRVLKPGGVLWAVVPDILKALQWAERGQLNLADLYACVFGDHSAPGLDHRSVWSEGLLAQELLRAGFAAVGCTPPSRAACPYLVSEVGWQAVVVGHKPG